MLMITVAVSYFAGTRNGLPTPAEWFAMLSVRRDVRRMVGEVAGRNERENNGDRPATHTTDTSIL